MLQTRITILIKAYCVNIVIYIKLIYLNKRYLFQKKINYFDKTYFCFAKIKLFKQTFKKDTLTQMFPCEFCEISKNTFYRTPLGDCFSATNSVPLQCLQTIKLLISSCRRTGETILEQLLALLTAAVHYFHFHFHNSHLHYQYNHFHYH